MGCVECCSRLHKRFLISSKGVLFISFISATVNSPVVSVPVLSNTMVCALANSSIVSPPFTSKPDFAPRPSPTIIAVGVASPMAQGQEITNTAMARIMAT